MRLVVTRVLSSAYKGDFAIALAMLTHLRDEKPDWQLTIMCRDPESDSADLEKFGTIVPELFSDTRGKWRIVDVALRLSRYLLWAVFKLPCLDQSGKRYIEAVSQARAVVFCGGGSPGGYGLHNLILHAAAPTLIARKLNVPVIFTGIGHEPDPGPLQRLITRWVLRQATLVIARDPATAHTIDNDSETEVRVAGDWAFLLPRMAGSTASHSHPEKLHLGINLRDPGHSSELAESRRGPGIQQTMSAMLMELLERSSADITIVSMNRSRSTNDYAFARRVCEDLPVALRARVTLLCTNLSPEEVKASIATTDLFISTRLHPAIFALEAGVPTLALHHAEKVRDMMHYLQLPEYFLPIENSSPTDIVDKVMEMLEKSTAIRRKLKDRNPMMHNTASKNLELLSNCLSNQCS